MKQYTNIPSNYKDEYDYSHCNYNHKANNVSGCGYACIQASSDISQFIIESNKPQIIKINKVDGHNNIDLNTHTGEFKISKSGEYMIIATPQVGMKFDRNNRHVTMANFRCWIRVNGQDVKNSNVLMNINPYTKNVITTQGIVSLCEEDTVEIVMASDKGGGDVFIEALNPSTNEPLVPSIIFSMYLICK